MYASNVLNLQRLSSKIRSKPARKHSTYLHRKLEIIRSFHTANSCRISTLNCLQYTPNAGDCFVFLCNAADPAQYVGEWNVFVQGLIGFWNFKTFEAYISFSLLKNFFAISCFKHAVIFKKRLFNPQHNFKKIRNNVEKSNESKKPKCLMIEGKSVTWKMFKEAFNWDQSSCSLPLHERLTPLHFEMDPAARMRNHLAEDVLDNKMLFLMQVNINNSFLLIQ